MDEQTSILLHPLLFRIIIWRILSEVTAHTYAPYVYSNCFVPFQIVGTSQFVSVILDIIGTTSSFGVGFFSSESLIMIPQEEDQEQRALPELRFCKNQAETLEKGGCRTQKALKLPDLGTKQGNQVYQRPCRRRTTLEEELGVGTVSHEPTRAARELHAIEIRPPDFAAWLVGGRRTFLCWR